jgi:hypothetical protein
MRDHILRQKGPCHRPHGSVLGRLDTREREACGGPVHTLLRTVPIVWQKMTFSVILSLQDTNHTFQSIVLLQPRLVHQQCVTIPSPSLLLPAALAPPESQ